MRSSAFVLALFVAASAAQNGRGFRPIKLDLRTRERVIVNQITSLADCRVIPISPKTNGQLEKKSSVVIACNFPHKYPEKSWTVLGRVMGVFGRGIGSQNLAKSYGCGCVRTAQIHATFPHELDCSVLENMMIERN